MVTSSERAVVRPTHKNAHASWVSYKVHLKTVDNQNPLSLVQKLCTQHIRHSLLISLPYEGEQGPLWLRRVSSATLDNYHMLCEGTLSRIKTK